MNKVECSSEYIGRLWAEVWSEIGADPNAPGANPSGPAPGTTADPEVEAKKRAATLASIRGGLSFILKKHLPAWEITPEEINELAEAYTDLVLWFWPDTGVAGLFGWWQGLMDRYGPLLTAIYVTGKVFGSRVADAYLSPPPPPADDEEQEAAHVDATVQ